MERQQLSSGRTIVILSAPVVLVVAVVLIFLDIATPQWLGIALAIAWPATAFAGCAAIAMARPIPLPIKIFLAPLYFAVFGCGLVMSLVATGVVLV
jgi:phosphoglycerol transferase MdoB-like AlkP superfamily enzyme